MLNSSAVQKYDADGRSIRDYSYEKQDSSDLQKPRQLQKVHSNQSNFVMSDKGIKEIEEAEQEPEHNNFIKFIQIFNYQNLSREGTNTHLFNFICTFINNTHASSINGIWSVTVQNGKTFFVNNVLTLKLPHNPLFHIYKSFLDILIENEVSESEIDRLLEQSQKIRLRIESMHKSTMEEVQRKIGTTQSGHILGNKIDQFKEAQDEQTQVAIKNALKKMIAKDKQKIKKYVTKVIEKLRNFAISNQTESPDPLNEHSNSVQEKIMYNQDINEQVPDLINQLQGKNLGRNQKQIPIGSINNATTGGLGQGNKKFYKMQFYTSNNFFPSKNAGKKINNSVDKTQTNVNNKSNLHKKQYLNTENYIKEESSEENQMITEDEADFNKNIHNESGGVMNRR